MITPFYLFERNIQKVIAYHGTNNKFEKFDYSYIGVGKDVYGPGFYFVNSYEFADKHGSPGKYELTLDKYIKSGKKSSKSDLSKLIRWAPNYKDFLSNFSENEQESLNMAIDSYLRYDQIDAFLSIWQNIYEKRGNSRNFVENLVKLGYDGYIVEEDGYTLYIMYNIDTSL